METLLREWPTLGEGDYAEGQKIGEWNVYEKSGALKYDKTYKPKESARGNRVPAKLPN